MYEAISVTLNKDIKNKSGHFGELRCQGHIGT